MTETDTAADTHSGKIVVGVLSGAYGVQGEVRLKSFCAAPEDIERYAPLTDARGRTYHVAILRPIKNGFAARVAEIATKEAADALKGTELFADRSQLPSLPADEFYHADLIGLSVVDTGGAALGTIKSVQNHGADDLLEVQRPASSASFLLPFTRSAVPTVDLAAGRVVADPPEGLL